MDYNDFIVDRAQHMRPLEYELSENYNVLVRYLHDMGVLDNVPVGTLGPADVLSASDALSAPLRSLVVGGNSVQDGTPTPDTPVPIESVDNLALHVNDTQGAMLWNQRQENGNFASATGWIGRQSTISIADGIATVVPSSDGTLRGLQSIILARFGVGHKLFLSVDVNPNQSINLSVSISGGSGVAFASLPANTWSRCAAIWTDSTVTAFNGYLYALVTNSLTTEAQLQFRNAMVIDLTDMFGAGNEPTTVEEFTAQFPEPYYPYDAGSWIDATNWPVQILLTQPLRSLPNGIKDILTLSYLRPSTRDGWSWYEGEVVRKTGQTTQAVTDGITGTVGTDVMSTTGEITDGPTVIYELTAPTAETLPEIELPSIVGPTCTIYATADATPQLTAQYIQNLSASIADMQTAIADIISG